MSGRRCKVSDSGMQEDVLGRVVAKIWVLAVLAARARSPVAWSWSRATGFAPRISLTIQERAYQRTIHLASLSSTGLPGKRPSSARCAPFALAAQTKKKKRNWRWCGARRWCGSGARFSQPRSAQHRCTDYTLRLGRRDGRTRRLARRRAVRWHARCARPAHVGARVRERQKHQISLLIAARCRLVCCGRRQIDLRGRLSG